VGEPTCCASLPLLVVLAGGEVALGLLRRVEIALLALAEPPPGAVLGELLLALLIWQVHL